MRAGGVRYGGERYTSRKARADSARGAPPACPPRLAQAGALRPPGGLVLVGDRGQLDYSRTSSGGGTASGKPWGITQKPREKNPIGRQSRGNSGPRRRGARAPLLQRSFVTLRGSARRRARRRAPCRLSSGPAP